MTPEEMKREIESRGWSIVNFADQLGVGVSTLRNALAGHTPMTKALKNHIELALGKREAILVYRVAVDDRKVEELTAGRGCVTAADHRAAMEAILHSNLQELIRIGAQLDWTPEERAALGLATAPEPPPVLPAPASLIAEPEPVVTRPMTPEEEDALLASLGA